MESLYNVVCYGEVLWDILPSGRLAGGAPMNVAYHLQKLGSSRILITKTGNDQNGKDLLAVLAQAGVPVLQETDSQHPTGLVYAHAGEDHEMTYDIVYPSAWDFIEWKQEYADRVATADYLVFGSLASRNAVSRKTLYRLLDSSRKNVFDINLRPPHFDRELLEYLLLKTDMLKMNLSELRLVSGWYYEGGDVQERMRFVRDRFDIPTMIVTKGGDGATVLHGDQFFNHPGFKVMVQDTIGSGDSFLAGFLAQLMQGAGINEALNFASAIGAFVATKAGGCPPYEVEDVLRLRMS